MIAANGYIREINECNGGGFDENGLPVASKECIDRYDCTPCSYHLTGQNKSEKGVDSYYTSSSYEILIDNTSFNANSIKLYDKRDREIGTLQVNSIEFLDVVDATKIIAVKYAD